MHDDAPRVRGILLTDWAERAQNRFGSGVFATIRALVDPALPDAPEPAAWYPAELQLQATRMILAHGCGGDERALIDALVQDGLSGVAPSARAALRLFGPRRVFARAGDLHPHVYSVGTCNAETGRRVARLTWTGAGLFGDPTWRLLQRAAALGVVAAAGVHGAVQGDAGDDDDYSLELTWK